MMHVESWTKHKHGGSRIVEQVDAWSKHKHESSRSLGQAEAWSMHQHGAYAWIRNVERKAKWSMH
jgi:hypothetical protein